MTDQPVEETLETTGGMGGPEADDTPGSYDAGITETTATGAGPVDDPSNSYLVATLDTSATGGGGVAFFAEPDHHDYAMKAVEDGTLSTLEPGSPTEHVQPEYSAPPSDAPGTIKDTTLTDDRRADGVDPDETNQMLDSTMDTVNFVAEPVASALIPAAMTVAPTVVGGARGATVTFAQIADPVGAPITAYRVEVIQGDPSAPENHWPGVDWAPRGTAPAPATTSVFVSNLNPDVPDIYSADGTHTPGGYRFRVAAVNANGTGDASPWSALVQAYNPDEPAASAPGGLTVENRINPIYNPDGTVQPGTGGTTGPVQALTAAPTATPGELDVDWTAPSWGDADGFVVRASSGQQVTVGDVATATLTGLASGVAVTVTVTPTNEAGNGISATSAPATPL